MPLTLDSTVVASDNQVSTVVGGEIVILGMHDGLYYGLDAVGARLWELLRTPVEIRALVTAITAEFDVELERCARDVLAIVGDLESRGLVRRVPLSH